MWVMTSFGILMPAVRPEGTVEPGDPRTLQVRTRRRVDLEVLRDEYMGDLLGEIIHTPDMDYNYRAYCRPEDFGIALVRLTADIDYTKFKPTTEDRYGDKELHGVYNSIWGTVTRLGTPWEGRQRRKRSPWSWEDEEYSSVSRASGRKPRRRSKGGVKSGIVKNSPHRVH